MIYTVQASVYPSLKWGQEQFQPLRGLNESRVVTFLGHSLTDVCAQQIPPIIVLYTVSFPANPSWGKLLKPPFRDHREIFKYPLPICPGSEVGRGWPFSPRLSPPESAVYLGLQLWASWWALPLPAPFTGTDPCAELGCFARTSPSLFLLGSLPSLCPCRAFTLSREPDLIYLSSRSLEKQDPSWFFPKAVSSSFWSAL